MNKRKHLTSDGMEYLMCPNAKQIKLSLPSCEQATNGPCSSDNLTAKKLSPRKVNTLVDDLMNGVNLDDFSEPEDESDDKILDLSTWKRCIVDNIQYNGQDTIISGHEDLNDDDDDGKRMVCRLQHAWAHCKLKIGDVVSIFGIWDPKLQSYCVSNMHGFIVVRPDFLVSGTTVLGGLFCMRKAVLSDRFKGIEAAMRIMTVGSIVHELFQTVLRQKLTTREEIKGLSEKMLSDGGMAYTLYASCMNSADARKEFDDFLEKIYDFVQRYIVQKSTPANNVDNNRKKDENFTGTISSIRDIEENIWVPRLGLKGKVDVSIHVRNRSKNGSHSEKSLYMPLELKTGRPSFSAEHTGQLILYQMMMSEIESKQIDSGLLLYLRDGVMREIKGSHNEQRDLILLRNEISYYLAKQYETYSSFGKKSTKRDNGMEISIDSSDPNLLTELLRISNIPDLPGPIDRANVCSQCPYNVICSVYLTQDTKTFTALRERHPMREIVPLVTSHLSDSHLNYFFHWVGLLMLEDQENGKLSPMKAMWLQTAEQREQAGSAVANLKLDKNVICQSDMEFVHEFIAENKDLTVKELAVGSYLIVSIPKRPSIAAGRVISVTQKRIRLILERNLLDRYDGERFILDKHESQTTAVFNMSNMGALLNDNEAAQRLRSIVIDCQKPTFKKILPKILTTKGKPILATLNTNQRTAILKALTANEYFLVKGLPGTGKTQTLTALIRLLVIMGKSILITSHTHSAVDNLLMRLMKCDVNIKFMRLGSASRIRNELKEHSEHFFTKNCKTPDDLAAIYNDFNVFGVTCFGSGHPLLTHKVFDVCLVDESSQVFQTTVLRPLFSAKKIILVGDPDQLPPIVRSPIARHLGGDESLFARLDSPDATAALTLQYRMNKTITKLANDLTYNGALQCANDEIANATLRSKIVTKSKWLQRILTPHIDQSVIFLNTGNVWALNSQMMIDRSDNDNNDNSLQNQTKTKNGGRSYVNYCETAIILTIINELKAMNIQSKMIGVIAPYGLQVELLRKVIERRVDNEIEVNTVDQYQGRDKEVIIYSCTRTARSSNGPTAKTSNDQHKNAMEILDDQRRLTVAITRAKHKLIMIGDQITLENYRPFKKLIESMSKMNKLQLTDHQQGFDWQNCLSVLN